MSMAACKPTVLLPYPCSAHEAHGTRVRAQPRTGHVGLPQRATRGGQVCEYLFFLINLPSPIHVASRQSEKQGIIAK